MSINWVSGPGIKAVKNLEITKPTEFHLDNQIPVYEIHGSGQPLIKIDIVFKGGRLLESKQLSARFTAALMRESTQFHSASEIAEVIDFCGANIRSASNMDYNYLTFSCLNRHLNTLIPIIAELVLDPIFKNDEIEKYRKKSIENLKLDLAQNELICYREFTSAIYGDAHPYGYNTTEQSLKTISQKDIIEHYEKCITSQNCFIIVSGLPTNELRSLLNRYFGQFNRPFQGIKWVEPEVNLKTDLLKFESKNKYQTSIKLGRRLFNRKHPDYTKMYLLNTILGGYFGSRLMVSVREQKGFTYNIYSTVDHMVKDGYFYISTEVDNEYVKDTISLIKSELNEIKQTKVNPVELNMVKNYLSGNFLNLVDGPFLLSTLLRSLLAEGRNLDDFTTFYTGIQSISSEELLHTAKQYFDESEMIIVMVGE